MVLGVKMAEIFKKNAKTPIKKTHNRPIESVQIKNRTSSCSNQAHMMLWAKISWSYDFWWLWKMWTDRQADNFIVVGRIMPSPVHCLLQTRLWYCQPWVPANRWPLLLSSWKYCPITWTYLITLLRKVLLGKYHHWLLAVWACSCRRMHFKF